MVRVMAETNVYLMDTIGELGLLYRTAPFAFVGGSLVEHGGQNPLEAARLGLPVLHGPHVFNFRGEYDELDAAGVAREVADAALGIMPGSGVGLAIWRGLTISGFMRFGTPVVVTTT